MTKSPEVGSGFEALERRLRTILPQEYQDHYEDVQPVSMGSASLKYGADGRVAWDEIWGTFCDLAMAGGPPHKGKLLEPGASDEIDAQPGRYREVVDEICRGIRLTTGLSAGPSPVAGWVRVECESRGTAEWLVRAIVMENVSARFEGSTLDLPAGPGYRVEKEIKNVITAISKTCHYWLDHTPEREQRVVARLFEKMESEWPFIQPAIAEGEPGAVNQVVHRRRMAASIREMTGLQTSDHQYAGWIGVKCPDVRAAIWMMRALVASNVLSRREDAVLFLPMNPASDPGGETVTRRFAEVHGFAIARGVVPKTGS